MKRVKCVIALMAAAMMALSLCSPAAFGADRRAEKNQTEESTHPAYSQKSSFDADARLLEIRTETKSDEDLIKETVSLLFDIKCDQLTGTEKEPFDYSAFWAPGADPKNGLQYFEDSIALEKGTLARDGAYYYDTDETLTFQEIAVSEDRAAMSVYEWFRYMDSTIPYDEVIVESGSGIDYRFELVKQDGAWYISVIDFDNEATEPLKNGEMTVEEILNSHSDIVEPAIILGGDPNCDAGISSLNGTPIPLDLDRFRYYAVKYSGAVTGISGYNSKFANYAEKGDCQNFASQCLWYGFGGTDSKSYIAGKNWPMVTSGNHQWYQSNAKYDCSSNYSWTSCTNFGNYIKNCAGKDGPCGTIYSGISKAQVGDLIQYSEKNSEDEFAHVFVVVSVQGTYGSRTANDITVCAHTENVSSKKLTTFYDAHSDRTWRTIHVPYEWKKTDPNPVV